MRILVGILHTIENEYTECLESIRAQQDAEWDLFVIDNMPNKLAHETLYARFMENAAHFGLFMKIDADMVLQDRHFFARMVEHFNAHPKADLITVSVHDWFSDRRVVGLNTFRNSVRWSSNREQLFVDDCPISEKKRLTLHEPDPFCVMHCPNPSPFQAFHFGIHKGLKCIEAQTQGSRRLGALFFHLENVELVREHFYRNGDRRLGLAALGAELALVHTFEPYHVNYSDPYCHRIFEEYQSLSVQDLKTRINSLQLARNGRFALPWRWRLRIRKFFWQHALLRHIVKQLRIS